MVAGGWGPNWAIPEPGPKIPQRNPVVFIQQKAMKSISIMHKIQYHTNMIGIIIKQYFGKRKDTGGAKFPIFRPKVAQNSVVHIMANKHS